MSSSGNYHLVWNDAVRQATAPFEYCLSLFGHIAQTPVKTYASFP